MAVVRKYRLWCETEATYVYAWAEAEPTQCPNNSAHSIGAGSAAVVESVGDAQTYTPDGAAITVKRDQAEITGNAVLMKRLDVELAPESCAHKDWVIPAGKTWRVRLFAASAIAHEVEARLEYFRKVVAGTTTAPASTTTAPPDAGFERVNPFDGDAAEPIAVLKLNGNSDSMSFYENLPFAGDGESFLRVRLANKDALNPVEASAYFNGYETDTPA